MASYFTPEFKQEIRSLFNDHHESFSREITVFKNGEKVIVTSDPNYNAFYNANSGVTSYQEVSQKFQARIKFISADEEIFSEKDGVSSNNSQSKIVLPAGSFRLKVTAECWNFIRAAKRIEFEGGRYSIVSNGRPIGPFDIDYYMLYLIPTDE